MGVAYNSVYLVWFEVGRTEWLRDRGLPYAEIEAKGLLLPLTEAALRMRSGARYDELLEIETRLEEVRSRRIVFGYRILGADRCVAEGTTTHVPTNAAAGGSIRVPEWLASFLGSVRDGRS
jgi:acyl-CoA thioester hydrolase